MNAPPAHPYREPAWTPQQYRDWQAGVHVAAEVALECALDPQEMADWLAGGPPADDLWHQGCVAELTRRIKRQVRLFDRRRHQKER